MIVHGTEGSRQGLLLAMVVGLVLVGTFPHAVTAPGMFPPLPSDDPPGTSPEVPRPAREVVLDPTNFTRAPALNATYFEGTLRIRGNLSLEIRALSWRGRVIVEGTARVTLRDLNATILGARLEIAHGAVANCSRAILDQVIIQDLARVTLVDTTVRTRLTARDNATVDLRGQSVVDTLIARDFAVARLHAGQVDHLYQTATATGNATATPAGLTGAWHNCTPVRAAALVWEVYVTWNLNASSTVHLTGVLATTVVVTAATTATLKDLTVDAQLRVSENATVNFTRGYVVGDVVVERATRATLAGVHARRFVVTGTPRLYLVNCSAGQLLVGDHARVAVANSQFTGHCVFATACLQRDAASSLGGDLCPAPTVAAGGLEWLVLGIAGAVILVATRTRTRTACSAEPPRRAKRAPPPEVISRG